MYQITINAVRLERLGFWRDGYVIPPTETSPLVRDGLKNIAHYILKHSNHLGGQSRFDKPITYPCSEYLYISESFNKPKITPLIPYNIPWEGMVRYTWNDFLDLPYPVIEDVVAKQDTLLFLPWGNGNDQHKTYRGVFCRYVDALHNHCAFTFTPVRDICQQHGYDKNKPFPPFRVWRNN